MSEILVKEYRGPVAENLHRGSIAIVSSTGDTIAYLGDIEKQTFMRSASKPIQILPTLLAGLHQKYDLNEEEVAIMNSSHWGSNHHIFVLEEIARKTGISPDSMVMKPCSSTSESALAAKLSDRSRLHPRQGTSKLQHCCSGKHFGLMLLQRELTGAISGYQDKDSPAQKQILSFISMLSQTPTFKIGLGVDGCGVPVFALPLRSIAGSYAKLADPFSLSDELKEIIDYNFSCIHKHPEKINDYGTPSYYVNQNPDLIMKDGSRGVICMAIKSMKLGIAVKLEDGWTDEFQGLIIASILEQLHYDDPTLIERLKNCYNTKVYNDCGMEVGHVECDFTLNIDETFFEDSDSDMEDDADIETLGSLRNKTSHSKQHTGRRSGAGVVFDENDDPNVEDDSDYGNSDYDDSDYDDSDYDDSDYDDSDYDDSDDDDSDYNDEDYDGSGRSSTDYNNSEYDGEDYDGGVNNKDESDYDDASYDDDAHIDELLDKLENQETDTPDAVTLSEEEQRQLRNRRSILGMTVVMPSKGRTVISNPRVDPISAGPGVIRDDTDDPASKSRADKSGSGSISGDARSAHFADPQNNDASGRPDSYGRDSIKTAHIISQKKRKQ